MKFSEESRFFVDNTNLIKDTFVLKSYSYMYFLHFLRSSDFISEYQFQNLNTKLSNIKNYLCEIDHIVDTFLPELLFALDQRPARIILLSLDYYCTTHFGFGENIYGNSLHLWYVFIGVLYNWGYE